MEPLPPRAAEGGRARVSLIDIDRASQESLTRQITDRLREMVHSGALAPGSRMISTRRLAAELAVSRNIALNAFDQLLAEGYLEARTGSGTYVAAGARFTPREMPDLHRSKASGSGRFTLTSSIFARGFPTSPGFPFAHGRA